MATAPHVPTPQTSTPPTPPGQRQIRIVSHSSLFYWWPVWAAAFIFGLISYFAGQRMAIVPAGTVVGYVPEQRNAHAEPVLREEKNVNYPLDGRFVLIVEKDKVQTKTSSNEEIAQAINPRLHISRSKNLGVLFCTILLLVITITSIPLRGLWSVIVIVFIVFLSIIFALLDWWEPILTALSFLDVRINTGGYFLIALVLFILWFVIFVFFDKQTYMIFTPGQLRVRLEIGEGETAYDTTGMTIQKQRSDLFRHWILGLGSGDLIVRTTGAQAHHFDLPNVLFLGRKVKEIEDMLRSRQMVTAN
jgi:hypothetical protein